MNHRLLELNHPIGMATEVTFDLPRCALLPPVGMPNCPQFYVPLMILDDTPGQVRLRLAPYTHAVDYSHTNGALYISVGGELLDGQDLPLLGAVYENIIAGSADGALKKDHISQAISIGTTALHLNAHLSLASHSGAMTSIPKLVLVYGEWHPLSS